MGSFALVGLVVWIEQVVGFVVDVVGFLWLIKEGFGRAGQPVNTSQSNQLKQYL